MAATVQSISDTVLVCRPEQYREAAVILSCHPADRFTPLIVLEPPPTSEDEYRKLHEDYRTVRNQRDDTIGGQLGRFQQIIPRQAMVIANEDVDRKAERLTPFRSWWKHNRAIADLLRGSLLTACDLSLRP
jgi:hypothetical protein